MRKWTDLIPCHISGKLAKPSLLLKWITIKILKIRTPEKFAVIILIFLERNGSTIE